jgi:uncharacterized protein (TIGR00251 family)
VALVVVETDEGCVFQVRVVPRSRRDEVSGVHGDALKVRLTAPPVEGKANRALQKFLAKRLGVAPSAIEILSGHASRSKRICVQRVSPAAIHALLAPK